ncbi:MAG: hypothetical protein JAZ03_21150, partial [Candidatus Thiodiazotropha taylori]|nr:hypothetical protein [Candidatus Thiodiazotropha taylori]MCW4336435.1 hypothetical protein [Candidatus Thiodiazotropha endolucinida]
ENIISTHNERLNTELTDVQGPLRGERGYSDIRESNVSIDEEERAIRQRLKRLLVEEEILKQERIQKERAERQMEDRLKALAAREQEIQRESARKERVRALKLEEERLHLLFLENKEKDREWQERMDKMRQQELRLEEGIAHSQRSKMILERDRIEDLQTWNREATSVSGREPEHLRRLLQDETMTKELLQIVDDKEDNLMRNNGSFDSGVRDSMRQTDVRQNPRVKQEMLEQTSRDKWVTRDIGEETFRREYVPKRRSVKVHPQGESEEQKGTDEETYYRDNRLRKEYEVQLSKKEAELQGKEERHQQLTLQLEEQDSESHLEFLRKKEELERKERYLKELEGELLNKEENLRRTGKAESASTKAEVTHFMKPLLTTFSGIEPTPKNESSFEDWKAETQCLLKSKIYPEYVITQAIRNSLKGQARKALITLDPLASSNDIISKLDSLFGNVASGQSVLQEFFTASQREDESVTMWGLRIEEILQRAVEKGDVASDRKNEMLRSKFWRSLFSLDLKNATRVYFDKVTDFEEFRSKVRAEERELQTHKKATEFPVTKISQSKQEKKTDSTANLPQHQPIQIETGTTKLLQDLSRRLEKIEKSLSYRRFRKFNQPNKNNQSQQTQDPVQQEDANTAKKEVKDDSLNH